jgi:hypothetical protein
VEKVDTYSGSFSEMIDTLLNGWYLRANKARSSAKGQVVTGGDIQKHRKQFRLLSLAYPLFWLVSRLDRLLVFQQGYKLIVKARLAKPEPELALR